jgi:2-keto-4-pentenoate hydratase/2-oxohepta-3-ene-1,7-dioic acid hydratase in catechol pathway
MRLASYRIGGRATYGAVVGDGLVDLGRRLSPQYPTLLRLIAGDGLHAAASAIQGEKPDHAIADVEFLLPVPGGEKILCIGVNYGERTAEYKDQADAPKYPSMFFRVPGSLAAHEQPIVRPTASNQFDYEGEIAMVIGKGGRHIPRERAIAHVFGLTLCNEGSVSDWLRHGKFNVTQGKNFDRSGSLGPWIVTADEIDLTKPLRLTTRVNGEVRQADSTANIIFSFADLIAYVSTFMTLTAGDVISTGTPTGAGRFFSPPRWLVPGDVVEVEVPEIGLLRNSVIDEASGRSE